MAARRCAKADSWFFITADYGFGHALENDTAAVVKAAEGKVVVSINMPFPSTDFSSAIVQAQASDAKVIGLANVGADAVNAVKQAAKFGVTQSGKTMAALLLQINDVHALGLEATQRLNLAEVFYWDTNDRTRAFAARVQPQIENKFMPNMGQARCCTAALHYLKVAGTMGAAEAKKSGAATVARMKAVETDDDPFGRCHIREDARELHPRTSSK